MTTYRDIVKELGFDEIGSKGSLTNKLIVAAVTEMMNDHGFAQMASSLLFSFPEHENAATIHYASEDNEHDFAVLLVKRGKLVPTQEMVDNTWNEKPDEEKPDETAIPNK